MEGAGVGTLATASESFLLAAVSEAFEVVSAKLAAVSCWRTVVSLNRRKSQVVEGCSQAVDGDGWGG